MNKLVFLIIFSLQFMDVNANYIRGAQISYLHLGGNQYEFTVVTCTKLSVLTDMPVLDISYGGQTDTISRTSQIADTVNDCLLNFYVGTHTFPGNGTYIVSVMVSNRTSGIINIPNSINASLCVTTQINISPFFTNHSVKLDPFPCPMNFCQSQNNCSFISAADPDGDSLSFELVPCAEDCDPIGGYQYPVVFGGNFSLDQTAGEICWDSPTIIGDYNIAVKIHEWKLLGPTGRVYVGYVVADFQLKVISGCITNMNENELQNSYSVFPNPFSNSITVNADEIIQSIKIFDLTGKFIYETKPNGSQINLELNIENGIYILEIFAGDKIYQSKIINN